MKAQPGHRMMRPTVGRQRIAGHWTGPLSIRQSTMKPSQGGQNCYHVVGIAWQGHTLPEIATMHPQMSHLQRSSLGSCSEVQVLVSVFKGLELVRGTMHGWSRYVTYITRQRATSALLSGVASHTHCRRGPHPASECNRSGGQRATLGAGSQSRPWKEEKPHRRQ